MTQTDIISRSRCAAWLALKAFGSRVVEDRWFALGRCRFSIWRNGEGLPPVTVGVCADDDEAIAVLDIEAFERAIKLAKPSLLDLCNDTELLRSVFPYALLPAAKSNYINNKTGHRPPPEMRNGSLIFYCNFFLNGRVLKIACSEFYEVVAEDVGAGFQMDIM